MNEYKKNIDYFYIKSRERLINILTKRLRKGSLILDVGAGYCHYSQYLSRQGYQVIALDVNKERLMNNSFNGSKVLADATQIPFHDNLFDGAICIEVIEHLEQPELLLKEIYRLLKPDSYCLITTPSGDRITMRCLRPFRVKSLISPDHKKEYKLNELFNLMNQVNLKVCDVFVYALDFPTPLLRLFPAYLLDVLIKPTLINKPLKPTFYKFLALIVKK